MFIKNGINFKIRFWRYYATPVEAVDPDRFNWDSRNIVFTRDESNAISWFLLHSEPIRNMGFTKVK